MWGKRKNYLVISCEFYVTHKKNKHYVVCILLLLYLFIWFLIVNSIIGLLAVVNPSSPKGSCNKPPTVYASVLKDA